MLASVLSVRKGCLVVVFVGVLFFDAKQHFLAHGRLELILLILRHGLPVSDVTRLDWLCLSSGCQHDAGCRVLGVVFGTWYCRRDTSCPNSVLVDSDAIHFPCHLRSNATNFVEYCSWCRAWCDEDVVGEMAYFVLRAIGWQLDQASQLLDVVLSDEVSCVEDGTLDPVWSSAGRSFAITNSLVAAIDHLLHLRNFRNWVHVRLLLANLDDFSNKGLSRTSIIHQCFVEVKEEVAEALDVLDSVLVDAKFVGAVVGEGNVAE